MNIRAQIFGGAKAAEEPPLVSSKKPKGARGAALDSIAVSRGETRRANTRNEDRHRLSDEHVHVSHNEAVYDVQLVNLSGGGAMVEGDFNPALWDRVHLHLGDDGAIECAVRWIKADRIGLEFAHETQIDCPPGERAVLLREVIARSFPDVELEITPEPIQKSEPADDKRRERRHPLIWRGTLHHDYQSTPVRLRNISSTGAQIESEAMLVVGSEPTFEIGDTSVVATVSWVVGDHAGLKFNQPFDLAQLARARPDIAPVKWERPAYLQPGAAADSPWAEQWSRASLGELREDLEGFLKR